ncbi:uncharacterized protein SCHCODRAFT_02685890 [Schizophyllum commune H4-8]|uniref:uncharacterized protein n=1 Tax=Schizophyllum commune (strain H4-8 / FGSC 9210) TaxID=578458 RepID=UPI00215F135C|nr:uncharacterized protein SCHCODRAFT_02685890 [Schizophyllum commune H4-8]KAI5896989.1 hypothetical protein SCHCODRAFT_02685890 [Schizophyllum commune H4-8]
MIVRLPVDFDEIGGAFYSYDVVQTSNPGWPGPPYPGGHSTAATLQTSPIAYSLSSPSHYHAHDGFARSPYPASSTANALFPTAPSFPSPGAHANSDRWRDMSAPATNDAPYLEYTGSDKPTPEDLRRALFIPRFSPPPPHWRALIPSEPEPDANGFYAPPINRFPVELLSYIFARCMDKEVEKPFYGYFTPNCTPLVIARVCRLWRYIALDLPLLWQHFSMRPCQGGGHYRIARLFMERTKGLGIYVYYAEDSRRGVYPREVCPCALDFIIRNIGLVKRLDLVEISPSSLLRLSRVRPGMATFMMKLAITTREANTKRNVAQALSSLYNTPTIREVEWSIPTFPENVHWSRIVSILLRECVVDTYTLMRIIASSPALQRIDVDITPDVSAVRCRPVYHGIMEELIIESDGPQDMLFQALDFPNLRRLYLRPRSSIPNDAPYSHGWPFLNIDNLYRFLGRLRAGLQYFLLVCGGASFDEAALLHIIRMPQLSPLKMLHIAELGRGASDAIFEELTLIEGSRRAVTLPHLQRLALCDCSTTDGTISRMLQSRDKASCPLRRLSLGYPIGEQRVHDADVATMEMLRRKGWMIFWSSCFGD